MLDIYNIINNIIVYLCSAGVAGVEGEGGGQAVGLPDVELHAAGPVVTVPRVGVHITTTDNKRSD